MGGDIIKFPSKNEPMWECDKCKKKGLAKLGIPKTCPKCGSMAIWHPPTDEEKERDNKRNVPMQT